MSTHVILSIYTLLFNYFTQVKYVNTNPKSKEIICQLIHVSTQNLNY